MEKSHRLIDRLNTLGTEIILTLREGPMKLDDLRKSIDARDTSILHTIKELEIDNLVSKDLVSRSYELTNIGRIYAVMFNRLFWASQVLRGKKDFWLQHDLSGIPDHLLIGIGALKDAAIIDASPSYLNRVHIRYLDLLKKSRRIDGVSPVFHPDFVEAMAERVNSGAIVRLIVTPEILERIREEIKLKDLAKYVKKIFIDRNLEVCVGKDLKVGLTVTETSLSLGLFSLNGSYDYSSDLICSQPQALEWGRKLFDHYRGSSEKIRFSSLL